MENKNELNRFLSSNLSVDHLNLPEPDPALISQALKKIAARKKSAGEFEDLFSLVAAFLNFKIRLYHAVLATVIVGGLVLYFNRNEKNNRQEARSDEYISNIASVRSSTVLSSIYTFGVNKKQNDGRASN